MTGADRSRQKFYAEYIAAHPGCLGTDCEKFEQFPILIKFIDAKNNLSIQVHPSNEYALKNEHQYGKTEMWYVLDCELGAYLYYGFDREISKEEFQERIKNNTLTEVLNAVPVHKGDCFFIPPGTFCICLYINKLYYSICFISHCCYFLS